MNALSGRRVVFVVADCGGPLVAILATNTSAAPPNNGKRALAVGKSEDAVEPVT